MISYSFFVSLYLTILDQMNSLQGFITEEPDIPPGHIPLDIPPPDNSPYGLFRRRQTSPRSQFVSLRGNVLSGHKRAEETLVGGIVLEKISEEKCPTPPQGYQGAAFQFRV